MGQSASTEARKRSVVLEVAEDVTAATPRAANRVDKNEVKTLLGGISPAKTSPSGSPVGFGHFEKASCASPVGFGNAEKASCASPVGFGHVETTSRQDLDSAAHDLAASKAPDASPRPAAPPPPSAPATHPAEECLPKAEQKPKAAPLLLPIGAVRSRREVAGLTATRSDGGDAVAPAPQASEGPKAEPEDGIPKLPRGKSAPSLLLPIKAVRSRRLAAERDVFGGDGSGCAAPKDETPMGARTTTNARASTASTFTRSSRRSVTFGGTQIRDFLVESDDGSESD